MVIALVCVYCTHCCIVWMPLLGQLGGTQSIGRVTSSYFWYQTERVLTFHVQVVFGSHWEIRHTRTIVMWPWRTLVKMILPCSVWLTSLLVANIILAYGSGIFQMEVKFAMQATSGISTVTEVRWWYVCIAEEVEMRGSTAVRYLMQWILPRPCTLECTQQAVVSGICTLNYFVSNIIILNEET